MKHDGKHKKHDDQHKKHDDHHKKNDDHHKKHDELLVADHSDEIKRLNRVVGQIEGVRKMLEEHRKLEDVLMQCKAIHSALKSVEMRILKTHLNVALDEIVKIDKKKTRAERVEKLEELFKHAS